MTHLKAPRPTSVPLRHDFRRRWLIPVLLLSALALSLFFGVYGLDHRVANLAGGTRLGLFERYLAFDPDHITDAVASLAGVIAAVFGIVITVVSIVVQLSASRFSGVTRLFLRDRINLTVMGYYVVTGVSGVWLSVALQGDFVPVSALLTMLVATTLGLVLMVPYFAYVFWFLEPEQIVRRIRDETSRSASVSVGGGSKARGAEGQLRTTIGLEQLTDLAISSISNKDKLIASAAVDAIRDFVLGYQAARPAPGSEWFVLSPEVRANPDFVAMDPESLRDLEHQGRWVEWKALRQLLGVYGEALAHMPDINYLVAIDTRYIGEKAGELRDTELVRIVLRYMNSYLRATLNARDVRTAYNVLNQYRLLLESLLSVGLEAMAVEGAFYLTYYGRTSYDMKLPFVTETIAYDLASLCERAALLESTAEPELMNAILELDQPLRSVADESAVLGVRKAQVKLATYYLTSGRVEPARRIADDMRVEPRSRLTAIRAALSNVTSKEFWEIVDRGRNFEYMPPAQQEKLGEFFAWLAIEPAPVTDQLSPNSIRVARRP